MTPHLQETAVDVTTVEKVGLGLKLSQGIVLGCAVALLAGYVASGFFALSARPQTQQRSARVDTKSKVLALAASVVSRKNVLEQASPVVPNDTQREYDRGVFYGDPPPVTGCATLTQQNFMDADAAGMNITLDFSSGCYEIVDEDDDVFFDHSLIVQGGTGSAYLTCSGATIRSRTMTPPPGVTGIVVRDSSIVRDCDVQVKDLGFDLTLGGSPRVESSSASNGYDTGFRVNAGEVTGSTATGGGTNDVGFLVRLQGQVMLSRAELNDYGFQTSMGGTIFNSTAANNEFTGFVIYEGASVSASLAQDNRVGFDVWGSTVQRNTAVGNGDGFLVREGPYGWDPDVQYNTATRNDTGFLVWSSRARVYSNQADNGLVGFHVAESATVSSSTAQLNDVGFVVSDDAVVSMGIAANNRYDGFLAESGTIYVSTAIENGTAASDTYGMRLLNDAIARNARSNANANGVLVDSAYPLKAKLLEGLKMCGNAGNDIFVNGGIVDGVFYISKPIQGAGDWNEAEFLPCPSQGGQGGGQDGSSPALLKIQRSDLN